MENRRISWEQAQEAVPIQVHYQLENEQLRYVKNTNRNYKNPPASFSMIIQRIDGSAQKTTCYPGSIIEGTVYVKVNNPISAHHLKLVFRASEVIYDITSSEKKKKSQIFAIRTTLWGKRRHESINDDSDTWPVLESGEHQFPFMCELPMVNYPPTFRHHYASCEFEMIASLERPGIRPFQAMPFSIRYEPFVLSTNFKLLPDTYQQQCVIGDTTILLTLFKGCEYNLLDTEKIPLQLHIKGEQNTIRNIQVYLKRKIYVEYGSYCPSDSMVIGYSDQSKCKSQNGVYSIMLPIPVEKMKKQDVILSKNFSVLGMTVTNNLSKYVKVAYELEIKAKVMTKHVIWSTKNYRSLFLIPLHFGTMTPGEQLPFNLLNYRDPTVINDTTLTTKPKFIKVAQQQEQLPAYDEDVSPPFYVTNSGNPHRLIIS